MPRNIRKGRGRKMGNAISVKVLVRKPLPSSCITHDSQTYPTRSAAESAFYATVNTLEEYNSASFAKCTHCNRHYVIYSPVESAAQLLVQQ